MLCINLNPNIAYNCKNMYVNNILISIKISYISIIPSASGNLKSVEIVTLVHRVIGELTMVSESFS